MASGPSEPWEMIERWKAEHPELQSGGRPAAPAPRPRLVPPTPPPSPQDQQREIIERWEREHPELTGQAAPRPRLATPRPDPDRRPLDDADGTPLTVLGAFIIGCILGGIAMTIITGIAFWGFSTG